MVYDPTLGTPSNPGSYEVPGATFEQLRAAAAARQAALANPGNPVGTPTNPGSYNVPGATFQQLRAMQAGMPRPPAQRPPARMYSDFIRAGQTPMNQRTVQPTRVNPTVVPQQPLLGPR